MSTLTAALSVLCGGATARSGRADVAVLGIPFDLATTNRPARFGPRSVREAQQSGVEGKAVGWGFSPLEELAIVDYGDCDFDAGNPAGVPEEIYQCAKQI